MRLYLKLAWRNLWRNKRRTLITMASVFFAVIMATLMMSMKEGSYTNMTNSMVASYTGFIQVHARGYWDSKSLDDSFVLTDSMKQVLDANDKITGYVERIESFALSATRETTKGAMVVGTDPEAEMRMTQLHERIDTGSYFEADDKAVLIGSGLAEYHKVTVGDTIVLLGQGYHGSSAAGKYPIKGIVKFGSPDLSKQLIMLPINEAKRLYGTEGTISNLVLLIDDPEAATAISAGLANDLGESLEVMAWPELVPDLVDMIEADRVEGYIFMFILYMVISFGIFGTVLMMMAERQHEFGVLVAVGMKRSKLALVVFLEVISISLLGALAGIAGAYPVIGYFFLNPIRFGGEEAGKMMEEYGMEPILQPSLDLNIFAKQALIVAAVASIIAIYPFISVLRLSAIKAMRS
ncbi:MAG TPA: ABC transporter permease [Flavobacteriales bacterium]|nr:ABC transporter permease [Flavobacteriales bacterium]HAW21646.1 ABC transporter permease [Flavobacteriales bacterium]